MHVEWLGDTTLTAEEKKRCEDAIKAAVGGPENRPVGGLVIKLWQSAKIGVLGGRWKVESVPVLDGGYERAAREALRGCLPAGHELEPT